MNYPIDINNTKLYTERLVIRPWTQADLYDFYEYAKVDGVGQMAGWPPHKNIEESQEILNKFIEGKKIFAIEYEGKAVGSIGIENTKEDVYKDINDLKHKELGFVLSKDYWGLGIMAEAVNEVIRYLFEEVGLDVITCGHFSWNSQSKRVQEKCGFKHYGYGKFDTRLGKVEEGTFNILRREDWEKIERGNYEILFN